MYTCIKNIPGILNEGAKFFRLVPIINEYPKHFKYDGGEFTGKVYSINGLTREQKSFVLRAIREKYYKLEDEE